MSKKKKPSGHKTMQDSQNLHVPLKWKAQTPQTMDSLHV